MDYELIVKHKLYNFQKKHKRKSLGRESIKESICNWTALLKLKMFTL